MYPGEIFVQLQFTVSLEMLSGVLLLNYHMRHWYWSIMAGEMGQLAKVSAGRWVVIQWQPTFLHTYSGHIHKIRPHCFYACIIKCLLLQTPLGRAIAESSAKKVRSLIKHGEDPLFIDQVIFLINCCAIVNYLWSLAAWDWDRIALFSLSER